MLSVKTVYTHGSVVLFHCRECVSGFLCRTHFNLSVCVAPVASCLAFESSKASPSSDQKTCVRRVALVCVCVCVCVCVASLRTTVNSHAMFPQILARKRMLMRQSEDFFAAETSWEHLKATSPRTKLRTSLV
jgi:hypothetical protein